MGKSKKAPALFEVIGNSTYQADSGTGNMNGIGRFGKKPTTISKPLPVKPKPKSTPPNPKVVTAKPPARTASIRKPFGDALPAKPIQPLTADPESVIQLEKGRVFFSLNMTNALIAAGVLGMGIFAAFLIGFRMGPDEAGPATAGTGVGPAQATVAPNVFSNPDRSGEKQALPLASVAKKTGPETPENGETVRFTSRGASNASASVEPVGVAVDPGSLGAVETAEPRTPGLTYIVIESFFKKEGHDGLMHARNAQAFLASKGVPSHIIPKKGGKIGWQLISQKGFDYTTEKRACLDYKQKIREFAKAYQPLPGGYGLFQGFPEKFIPSK